MRSRGVERLLRFLLVLAGVGVGLAAAQLGLELFRMANQEIHLTPYQLMLVYAGASLLGGLILLLLSGRIIRRFSSLSMEMQKQMDKMPLNQLLSAMLGLILGLIVAALLRQMISFLGEGILTTALTAILYLVLGVLGYTIGRRRSREFLTMMTWISGVREKNKIRRHGSASRKFVDTSALIDGRILSVAKAGFLEGEIVIPQFVVDELQRVADSSDDSRRERGRHGLDLLHAMQQELPQLHVEDTEEDDQADADVKLVRRARECGGTVITVDYNLQKAAAIAGIRALNVNELVEALRPAVTQGMILNVRVTREGKENGQGVSYMNDGTMIVIEGGRKYLGENVEVKVTSVLQTAAGRMIFARPVEPESVAV